MVIQRNRSHSVDVQAELALVLLHEACNEAAQASVKMKADSLAFGDRRNLCDGVDDSMRIVGVRSVKSNGVAVDEAAHVIDIHLVVFVESGLAHLDVEVHCALVQSSVDAVRDNT